MTFTDYCKTNNIQLLRDDLIFLRTMLNKIPAELRKRVLKRYCDEWLLSMLECENAAQKQNLGRRAANLMLVSLIKNKEYE